MAQLQTDFVENLVFQAKVAQLLGNRQRLLKIALQSVEIADGPQHFVGEGTVVEPGGDLLGDTVGDQRLIQLAERLVRFADILLNVGFPDGRGRGGAGGGRLDQPLHQRQRLLVVCQRIVVLF